MSQSPLDKLRANPRNPRTITPEKAAMLRNSLEKFGDLGGIVLNVAPESGQMVGGHQRVAAFREAASVEEHIEKRYAEPTKTGTVAEGYLIVDGERFAYREVLWDAPTEMAANLSANQQAGDFDYAEVDKMLTELRLADFDVDLTMFSETDRDHLATELLDTAPKHADEPDTPDPGEKISEVRTHDIFSLGHHRLMCGDSNSVDDVALLMDGTSADMVYTDPPYGMNLQQCNHQGVGEKRIYERIIGDDQDFDPTFILTTFKTATDIFLWGADYYRRLIHPGGSWVVWDKKSDADGNVVNGYDGSQFELCWSKKKHSREICRLLWQGFVGLHADGGKRYHPTQKPVALAEWFFARWGKRGDAVVDLFGGSGSALLACENYDRRCFMMEMDPKYCQVIIDRWEKMTGQKAVKL